MRSGRVTASTRLRCRISLHCVGNPQTASFPARPASGPVNAASLIAKHGSLEKLLASGRFAAQADKLRLYKSIATMYSSAPLPPLRNQKPTWTRAAKLAHGWNLNKLAERLEALAS